MISSVITTLSPNILVAPQYFCQVYPSDYDWRWHCLCPSTAYINSRFIFHYRPDIIMGLDQWFLNYL